MDDLHGTYDVLSAEYDVLSDEEKRYLSPENLHDRAEAARYRSLFPELCKSLKGDKQNG